MRFSNDEVFVLGSKISRRHVKRRLEKLIPYVCNECGQGPEWNGKKLVLQLEHKNGINNDNRLENLCFLCPNCHSQTETYAGRGSKGLRATKKKKRNYRFEKTIRDKEKLEAAKLNRTIRFGEWGWKTRFANEIEISAQKVERWLMRVDPEFLLGCSLVRSKAADSKPAIAGSIPASPAI